MLRLLVLSSLLALAVAGPPLVKTRQEIDQFRVALENSREDDGLTLEDRMAQNPQSSAWVNSGKFQGDMLLNDEQIEELVNEFSSGRMAWVGQNVRWPSNTAVWEFGANEFNLNQQRFIISVMDLLSARTCVRFRHRNANDRSFIRITGRPDGCYAAVGYRANAGALTLNLARNNPGHGCLNAIIIAHEFFHSFGFMHMQSTYNRYDYVRIHWENIQNGMNHNFYRYDNRMVSNLNLPYEYGSCMHYGTHDFSTNGRPTLSTTRHYGGVLGQTIHITGWDLWRLARMYNCPGAWSEQAYQEAKSTVYVADDDGNIVAQPADLVLPEELESLEPVQEDEQFLM